MRLSYNNPGDMPSRYCSRNSPSATRIEHLEIIIRHSQLSVLSTQGKCPTATVRRLKRENKHAGKSNWIQPDELEPPQKSPNDYRVIVKCTWAFSTAVHNIESLALGVLSLPRRRGGLDHFIECLDTISTMRRPGIAFF